MSEYAGLNYEKKEDCFEKTAHIESQLLFGNKGNINNPLFTILIPTYSRVNMLKEALNSVLRQWHVPFFWDIIVLDNEPYDGNENDTELLIRRIDNPRILYYRNSEHMEPGDNFNRGFLLARGKWVMMLHDDDILFDNTLQHMSKIVSFLERNSKRPLGAVSTRYHQFLHDENFSMEVLQGMLNWYLQQPYNYNLYRLTHANVLLTGHIGGDVPSNGATYNRKAVIEMGGFNENFGISADLILYYCLENKYDVYSTTVPMGFYRWGHNTMSKPESAYKTVKAGFDFREYVYSKNVFTKLWGKIFRSCQFRRFAVDVIQGRKIVKLNDIDISSFDKIYSKKPNKYLYVFYAFVIKNLYEKYKGLQTKRLWKKSLKEELGL